VTFDIHSYWRAGTGRGAGALLDELVHRDGYGLPGLPGRTVKGLLRDAVCRAELWGHIAKDSTVCWFGGASCLKPTAETENHEEITERLKAEKLNQKEAVNRLETKPGALIVSDACIDNEVRNYLRALLQAKSTESNLEGEKLRRGFFHPIYATRIEHETGSAQDKSLRGMEVAIPLKLTATLSVLPNSQLNGNWHTELAKCLPLIRSIGTSRSRGLGRVTVELEKL